MTQEPLASLARSVIESNTYMTLGTANAAGRPWVTRVYYSADDDIRFYWVSSPETRHSRNVTLAS